MAVSGEVFEFGPLRGRSYCADGEQLGAQALHWLRAGRVDNAQVLKQPNVFRLSGQVVKLYPKVSLVERMLLGAPALRAAQSYFDILPVPSPAPVLALAGNDGTLAGRSLLVSQYVAGRSLAEAWPAGGAVRDKLSETLALLYRHRVLHGDIHPGNLIWDGERLILIDLDALRLTTHSLRRLERKWWARLLRALDDEAGLRSAYARYVALRGGTPNAQQGWQQILARHEKSRGNRPRA